MWLFAFFYDNLIAIRCITNAICLFTSLWSHSFKGWCYTGRFLAQLNSIIPQGKVWGYPYQTFNRILGKGPFFLRAQKFLQTPFEHCEEWKHSKVLPPSKTFLFIITLIFYYILGFKCVFASYFNVFVMYFNVVLKFYSIFLKSENGG